MTSRIFGAIVLAAGLALVWKREAFARHIVREQNRAWRLNLGEREVGFGVILAEIGGILWVILGFFMLAGIVHPR